MENGTSVFHAACYAFLENKRGYMREDALFSACVLLAVAGFLLSPLEDSGGRTANALLFSCKLAFGVLSWTVLAALCARNPFGSIVCFHSRRRFEELKRSLPCLLNSQFRPHGTI